MSTSTAISTTSIRSSSRVSCSTRHLRDRPRPSRNAYLRGAWRHSTGQAFADSPFSAEAEMTTPSPCKVAALHAAPVFLDKQATLQKALSLIAEAANNGAQLVVFPESYIP